MRNWSSLYALIFVSLVFAVSGCTETFGNSSSSGNSAENEQDAVQSAESTLQALQKNQNINVKDSSRRYTVDGELHHIRAQIGESNELSRAAGILRDGEIVPLRVAETRLHEAHESEWGAISRPTAAWLSVDREQFEKRQQYSAWYASDGVSLSEAKSMIPASAEIEASFHEPPVIQFVANGHSALKLAKKPEFHTVHALVGKARDGNHGSTTTGQQTAGDYVFSRSTFNHRGNYAEEIDLAVVETIAETQNGISEFHDALYGNDVIHSRTPKSCQSDSDCPQFTDCYQSTCIGSHASKVASRFAATEIPFDSPIFEHAAQATIHIPNIGVNDIADSASLIQVYDSLIAKERWPMFVNESWGQKYEYSFEDTNYVRSWYSRFEKLTSIKISQNTAQDLDPDNENNETDCQGLNSVCVGGVDAQNSYDNVSDDSFGQFLSGYFPQWENPSFASSHPSKSGDKQAEQPDVVSEAVDTNVMNPTSDSGWMSASGTSFAAPTITGLLALTAKQCEVPYFEPAMARAMLRTAAWQKHDVEDSASDPRYPIPGQSPDSFAGAGIPTSHGMELYCGTESSDDPVSERKKGKIDPTTDQGWTSISNYPFMSKENFPETPSDNIVTHQLRTPSSVVTPLWEVGSPSRVRVTFSYYTCPPGEEEPKDFSQVDKNEPAVDFDLLLCSKDAGQCAAVSESSDDTDEGFDVHVPDELQQAGDVTVFLVKPDSSNVTPCSSAPNRLEPWASAIAWWPSR